MTEQEPRPPAESDSFDKLEPANLVVIGDGKNQTRKFGGLLVDIIPDDQYPDKVRYVVIGRDQKEYEIAGNAALGKRIRRSHIGCLMKVMFLGRERGSRNEYKLIEVRVQPRDRTTEQQKKIFPRWHDFEEGGQTSPGEAGTQEGAAGGDATNF